MRDLDNSYGYVFGNILQKFGKSFDQALKDYSIKSQHYRVIITLYTNENINQKKLAEILKIDRTTIVHLIDDLERVGYVKREKNLKDRRSFKLVLTQKGKSIIAPICDIRDKTHDETLKKLTDNEKKILREICRKIGDD